MSECCINLKKTGQTKVTPIFILSTGRAGTNWVIWAAGASIPSSVCVHEAPPCIKQVGLLYHQGKIDTENAYRNCLLARGPAITSIRQYLKKQYYIEANQNMFNLAIPLIMAFPDARLLGLIRDGRDFVTSMMNKGIYNNGYPYIEPRPETYSSTKWESWSLVQKISWNWMVKVQEILKIGRSNVFHIEDLLSTNGLHGLSGYHKWSEFWGTIHVPQFITLDYYSILRTHQVNQTRYYIFPKYHDWSEKDKEDFWAICGYTMNESGYLDKETKYSDKWSEKCHKVV